MRHTVALTLLLTACGAPTPLAWMPPPEFDRPFPGPVIYSQCAECGPLGPYYSRSIHRFGVCLIMLPDVSKSTPTGRAIAERIETANCNGWAERSGDVNAY